jgi:tetratricopeptide (TPR) repeat protein
MRASVIDNDKLLVIPLAVAALSLQGVYREPLRYAQSDSLKEGRIGSGQAPGAANRRWGRRHYSKIDVFHPASPGILEKGRGAHDMTGITGKLAIVILLAGMTIDGMAQAPTSNASISTSSPAMSVAQARTLLGAGKIDEAIKMLTTLASDKPEPAGAEATLGKAYYDKQEYETAVSHLELALKQNPNDPESTQLLGISYDLLGHLQQAIPYLEKVQSSMPEPDPTGSYILGRAFLDTRQFDKARIAFARMFSVSPQSAAAHLLLAKMMMREQFEEKAVPELQKALQIDPNLPMAHFMLGEIYLFKSNVAGSIDEFHKELAIDPMSWLTYWRMGDAYSRLEKWDDAERALKQSIWLDETFTGPYILLGKVEMKKGSLRLAAGFLEHALSMDPSNYYAHYLLGMVFKQEGRTKDADLQFRLTQTLRQKKEP